MIGQSNVSVPTHFFKVVVGETEDRMLEMEAFVLPNKVPATTKTLKVLQLVSSYCMKTELEHCLYCSKQYFAAGKLPSCQLLLLSCGHGWL